MKNINILFVCKYNRFRSRIALAYFNKINKNKKIIAKSAGIIRGSRVSGRGVKVAKDFGLNLKGKTQAISSKLLSKTDIIVIVANDVPKEIFTFNDGYIQKIIIWKIKDVNTGKGRTDEMVIRDIIKKVDELNKELNNK